jgi:hypothetical protein
MSRFLDEQYLTVRVLGTAWSGMDLVIRKGC